MMQRILGMIPYRMTRRSRTKYFEGGHLDFDDKSSAGRFVRENCKSLSKYILNESSQEDRSLFDLISRMLEYEACARMTLDQALRHPFFEGSLFRQQQKKKSREESNDSGLIRDSRSHSSLVNADNHETDNSFLRTNKKQTLLLNNTNFRSLDHHHEDNNSSSKIRRKDSCPIMMMKSQRKQSLIEDNTNNRKEVLLLSKSNSSLYHHHNLKSPSSSSRSYNFHWLSSSIDSLINFTVNDLQNKNRTYYSSKRVFLGDILRFFTLLYDSQA